ncbi:hypothetical protein GCM10010429_55160 [Micromonospora olivasterospora]
MLWSGTVDEEKAPQLVQHLMGKRLFNGWGVRSLAEGEARYNPIGYHVGTVWPFDNSVIAWGLRRYCFDAEAAAIAEGMFTAAKYFNGRLPEAFAGYDRSLTNYPVEYPTACSPQAWSTGAPLLLLRTMLGMEPRDARLTFAPVLPAGVDRLEIHWYQLCGCRAPHAAPADCPPRLRLDRAPPEIRKTPVQLICSLLPSRLQRTMSPEGNRMDRTLPA